jgi:predicted transcriptional regulator
VLIFSRLAKDEVMDNKTRYLMHGMIIENPGIHYSALMEEFELSNGVTAYHLDVLERESFVRSKRDGRRKRFYSRHAKVPKDQLQDPEEVKEAIVELVRGRPGIAQMEVMEELGIGRRAAGYHLQELVKEGKLQDSKKGKYTIYHPRE